MQIQQKDNGLKGSFFIEQNNRVDDVFKGQSAGKQMVSKAIGFRV